MGAGLSAVLEERVRGVRGGEVFLLRVREVQVVEREGYHV